MKAHLIDTHLLVPRSRLSAGVKVIYHCHISEKIAGFGALVFYKHILFFLDTTDPTPDSPTLNVNQKKKKPEKK